MRRVRGGRGWRVGHVPPGRHGAAMMAAVRSSKLPVQLNNWQNQLADFIYGKEECRRCVGGTKAKLKQGEGKCEMRAVYLLK